MTGSSFPRRLIAWAMLALYGLVASGLPLPVAIPPAAGTAAARGAAGKDRSQPFPCMDNPCGCDSADRCFSSCCCHTPAETLAWAKARGIEPAVIAALQRRAAEATPAAATSCCSEQAEEPSCCQAAEPAGLDDTICSDYRSLAADPPEVPSEEVPPPAADPPPAGVVILRAVLACGGIVAQWTAACVSLPPPAAVTCEIAWPIIGRLTLAEEPLLCSGGPPELPPPRAS